MLYIAAALQILPDDWFDPLPLETWAAVTALDAALARVAPKGPNPVSLTDANRSPGSVFMQSIARFATALPKATHR
jgi:hypothetical protein